MEKDDVLKLAQLAHIRMNADEAESLLGDLDAVLRYVSEIQEVSGAAYPEKKAGTHRNLMRDDEKPHQSGEYTEAILNEAPRREGEYIKVKKIL